MSFPILRAAALASLLLAGCGGPPAGARTAQRHLSSGNFEAADAAADQTLAKHPKDPTSWRVKIRAAMGRGELAQAAKLYQEWKETRGGHDRTAYRMMASTSLWQSMQVPSADIKSQAIGIVERHEIEKLAESVRDLLSDDSDLVAGAAASALLTSHPAAPDLATQLLRSEDPRARAKVVGAIAKKVGRIAIDDILPMLKDSSPIVRRAAVSGIGRWKNNKDRDRLLALAASDSDDQVRSMALRALLPMRGEAIVAAARKGLDDSYLGARIAAVALLDKRGGPEASSDLEALLTSGDLPVALRAAVALFKRDQRDNQQLLETAFSSPDWMTRSAALNALAGASERQPALLLAGKGLADKRLEVRLTAARVLLSLGASDPALRAMRDALSAELLSPRLLAATDLARRGEQDAIDVLSRLAGSGGPEQMLQAIAAHRAAGVVTDGLVAALGHQNIAIRLAAADVLLD